VKPWRVVGVLAAATLLAALIRTFGPPAASAAGSAFVPLALALAAVRWRGLAAALPARRNRSLEAIIEGVAGASS
jgi:hypothetical protein